MYHVCVSQKVKVDKERKGVGNGSTRRTAEARGKRDGKGEEGKDGKGREGKRRVGWGGGEGGEKKWIRRNDYLSREKTADFFLTE